MIRRFWVWVTTPTISWLEFSIIAVISGAIDAVFFS